MSRLDKELAIDSDKWAWKDTDIDCGHSFRQDIALDLADTAGFASTEPKRVHTVHWDNAPKSPDKPLRTDNQHSFAHKSHRHIELERGRSIGIDRDIRRPKFGMSRPRHNAPVRCRSSSKPGNPLALVDRSRRNIALVKEGNLALGRNLQL